MGNSPLSNKKLYGTATVGTKGQVVIPADAREEIGIKPGDRLYAVGSAESGFLCFLKEESLEQLVQQFTSQAEIFRSLQASKKEQE